MPNRKLKSLEQSLLQRILTSPRVDPRILEAIPDFEAQLAAAEIHDPVGAAGINAFIAKPLPWHGKKTAAYRNTLASASPYSRKMQINIDTMGGKAGTDHPLRLPETLTHELDHFKYFKERSWFDAIKGFLKGGIDQDLPYLERPVEMRAIQAEKDRPMRVTDIDLDKSLKFKKMMQKLKKQKLKK